MSEFIVMNTSTYVQYKVVQVGEEYKVYSMNGNEANISYAEIERGLAANRYKKM